MKNIRVIALLSLLMGPLAACAETPTIYESKPIEAWVVDADTGQPVEGAVVLARWEMSLRGQRLQGDDYTPKIVETQTDSTGRFYFPGWGPEPICCGFMDEFDPQIFIFKPGYSGIVMSDGHSAVVDDPRVRNPYWNGRKFQLKPYKGNFAGDEGGRDFEDFRRFSDVFEYGFLIQKPRAPCGWAEVPRFMKALFQQLSAFKEHGYHDRDSIIKVLIARDDELVKDDHCTSPVKFFKGLEP
ncbi:MAG TPA: carboxypeptidase-like regulatory domain-containing protein [Gammaproteobacteria bacterium]|nr:carboxypeptidase-like regulatory domain-containing protein [Gammaproteobacteria bacterium]